MKNRIVEIIELGQPQSIIQRENQPITELIKTDSLIKELNQQLFLYGVVVPKGTLPYPYRHQLERMDQLNQTQTDLKQQLQILRHFANKLGLYDASDYLKEK